MKSTTKAKKSVTKQHTTNADGTGKSEKNLKEESSFEALGGALAQEKGYKGDKEQLVEVKKIGGTPFEAVKYKEGWFISLGKYRLSEVNHITYEGAVEEALEVTWNRIIQVISIMMLEDYKMRQEEKTLEILENLKSH